MLTRTPRGLERDGYLTRTVTPITPARVDYALTAMGREVPGTDVGVGRLGQTGRIAEARRRYDARPLP